MTKKNTNLRDYQNRLQASCTGCLTEGTVAHEKKKKFTVNRLSDPKETIIKVEVDNCLIRNNSNKCDYAFIRCKTKDIFFIELKSEDINHAVEQIKSTIIYFKEHLDLEKQNITGIIVSNGMPKVANQKFLNLQKTFKKEVGLELVRGTNHYIKNI